VNYALAVGIFRGTSVAAMNAISFWNVFQIGKILFNIMLTMHGFDFA
jgi:hypothetical protein